MSVEARIRQQGLFSHEVPWQGSLTQTKRNLLDSCVLGTSDPLLKLSLARIDKAYYDYYTSDDCYPTAPGTFAFIVHPRDPLENDIARQFPVLTPEYTDPSKITSIFESLPPFVLGEYKGLNDHSGRPLYGYVLSAPLTVEGTYMQGLQGLINAKRKVIDTARFAREKLGADIVGLGETLGTLSKFGMSVELQVDNVRATTGHAYTVFLVGDVLMQGAEAVGIQPEDATLAVVGAGGAIGSSVAQLLSGHTKRIILVDKGKVPSAEFIAEKLKSPNVTVSNSLASLKEADLVVSATTDTEPFIKSEHIKPGAVIVDDSQPVNMLREEADKAHALLLHPIGTMPEGVERTFDFSLPEGTDFSCALELMALASADSSSTYEHRTVGRLEDIDKVRQIARLARSAGLKPAPLQRFGEEVHPLYIDHVRHIRMSRR